MGWVAGVAAWPLGRTEVDNTRQSMASRALERSIVLCRR